jgi:hypothetical protein
MPHEPKVGELPALPMPDATVYGSDRTVRGHAILTDKVREWGRLAVAQALAAEREARKDEARDAARYRKLCASLLTLSVTDEHDREMHGAWLSEWLDAALQAERPEGDRG